MTNQQSFTPCRRIQESLLAPLERRALIWLAERTPPFVSSDHLTLLGFSGHILAGVFYYLSRDQILFLHLVNLALVVNWFGDSLDGTLARYRNRQRPRYGYYVDHMVDSFGALFLLGGLALSGHMSSAVAVGLLIAYFLLAIHCYLAAHSIGTFRLSFGWFSPTELRLLLIVGNLALLDRPQVKFLGENYPLFDFGGAIGIGAMLSVLLAAVLTATRDLYLLEPVRKTAQPSASRVHETPK